MKYLAKQTLVIAMLILGVTGAWAQEIIKLSNGTWIFTMPNGERTLNVGFKLAWQINGDDVPSEGVNGHVGFESVVMFPELVNPNNLTVRYGSTEGTVATIDATTGAITFVAPGQTVIYAVHDADESHIYDSAYYTLTVDASYTLTLAVNNSAMGAVSLVDTPDHVIPITTTAGTFKVIPGTSLTVKAIPAEYHHLASWSNIPGNNPQQTVTMTKDSTITSVFAIDTFSLTLNADGNGTVTLGSINVKTFKNFDPSQFDYTDENITLHVDNPYSRGFQIFHSDYMGNNHYRATIYSPNGENITKVELFRGSPDCFYLCSNDLNRLTVEHGTLSVDGDIATITGINATSLTIGAELQTDIEIGKVKVYYGTMPEGVSENPAGSYYCASNTQVTVKATPDENNLLVSWSNISGSALQQTVTVTKDSSITALFTFDQYEVNASVTGGHGTVSPSSQMVNRDSTATIMAYPDEGYHTVWPDNSTDNIYTTGAITSATTVNVTFAINTYSVTLNDDIEDANNWTGKVGDATTFSAFPLEDVTATQTVTVKYDGTRRVKSITAAVVPVEPPLDARLFTPLTMVALTDGTILVQNQTGKRMKYTVNGSSSRGVGRKDLITNSTTINVSAGDTVAFYGNFDNNNSYYGTGITGGTAQVKLFGNIMSLISEEHFATDILLLGDNAFRGFFAGNTNLIDASGLLLPTEYMYGGNWYRRMFANCTNLTAGPKLTHTELWGECYVSMFSGCTNLSSVTCLATYIEAGSTTDWLSGVSTTGTFIKAADANWEEGASGIPSNWTIVNVAPSHANVTPTTNANEWTFAMPEGNVKLQVTYYEMSELAWNNLPADGSVKGYVGFENLTVFPTLNNPHELSPITFASTDPTVATINADGDVTFVAPGTTTIRAIYPGDDTHLKDTASYQLTVLAPAMLTLKADGDGTVEMAGGSMLSDSVKAGITASTYSVIPGTEVTLNAEAIALHHVADWRDEEQHDLSAVATYSDYAVTNPDRFPAKSSINVTVTGDTTMIATFGINSYEVSAAVANGQSVRGTVKIDYTDANNLPQTIATTATVTSVQATALGGSTTTLIAIPAAGYHFVNWTNGNAVLGTNDTLTTTEALTATAVFAPDTFTITYMDGTTELNVDTFKYLQPITDYTLSKAGWDFLGWSPSVPELMPAENLTVYAQWYRICDSIQDQDGNKYPSVNIGNKCWMAANMRATHYANGNEIPGVYEYQSAMYPNVTENVSLGGLLYDWYAAMDVEGPTKSTSIQGICPNGWHIPTAEDAALLNAVPATELRTTTGWVTSDINTNSTGFSAYPAGFYNSTLGRFEGMGTQTDWWMVNDASVEGTVTSVETQNFASLQIPYYCDSPLIVTRDPKDAISVRCVKADD